MFVVFQLEAKESKLSSSMNSIKTFWSPELKKERALRKDEATKVSVWKEQYRAVQEETQVCKRVLVSFWTVFVYLTRRMNHHHQRHQWPVIYLFF